MAEHASRISDTDGPLVTAARSAEGAARHFKEVGQARFTEAVDTSRTAIQENPLKAVLIAAGVGALAGYLIGRRR